MKTVANERRSSFAIPEPASIQALKAVLSQPNLLRCFLRDAGVGGEVGHDGLPHQVRWSLLLIEKSQYAIFIA